MAATLKKQTREKEDVVWAGDQAIAFYLKLAITKAPIFSFNDLSRPLNLAYDSSDK